MIGIIMCGLSLQSDPLTVLLAKYVPDPDRRPRRDVSGDYSQSDFQTLMVGWFFFWDLTEDGEESDEVLLYER